MSDYSVFSMDCLFFVVVIFLSWVVKYVLLICRDWRICVLRELIVILVLGLGSVNGVRLVGCSDI